MELKQFYNIATKVSDRKKCYYFWWFPWLLLFQCAKTYWLAFYIYGLKKHSRFNQNT